MLNTQTVVATLQPKEYISCADTAKEIRKALAQYFSGVKFSTRSKTYSGGASITVSWTDGPTSEMVDRIAGSFAGCTFDGQIDLKEYHASEYQGRRVQWGANFVFTSRHYSPALIDKACAYVETKYGLSTIDRASWSNDYRLLTDNSRAWGRDHVSDTMHQTLSKMNGAGVIVTLKAR